MEKKQLTDGISNNQIDNWYQRAREAGAIGGKLLGAGGGGFLLMYASPEYHTNIYRALPELRPVPFHFCPQGSKIIYVEESNYKP
jgi:D-glycero-alpha-D-manno-heptose-7-phosphate kinase